MNRKKELEKFRKLLNARDTFNAKYKVGSAVKVEHNELGVINTYVRHPATILHDKTVIAWFAHPALNGYEIKYVFS